MFANPYFEPNKAFEFLKLPAEIRNMIYWNALVKKRYCYFFFQPPLTLVNKQIRSESLPLLYGNSEFIVFFNYGKYGVAQDFNGMNWPRKLWAPPLSVSPVSAILSLVHVTKLDIRCFLSRMAPKGFADLYIHTRKKYSDYCYSVSSGTVGQPGFKWQDRADIEVVYRRLLREWLGQSWLNVLEPVYLKLLPVVKIVLFFAEMCPAAAEWVWLEIETIDERR